MTDPVNPPSTEAGRRLRELYAVLPTTDEGWRLAEEWMTGPLLNEQHGSVPERIKRIEEQARVEGRREGIKAVEEAAHAFWSEESIKNDYKFHPTLLWRFIEEARVAGLNASESGQPTRAELDALERETYEADPSSPYYRGQSPEASDE